MPYIILVLQYINFCGSNFMLLHRIVSVYSYRAHPNGNPMQMGQFMQVGGGGGAGPAFVQQQQQQQQTAFLQMNSSNGGGAGNMQQQQQQREDDMNESVGNNGFI